MAEKKKTSQNEEATRRTSVYTSKASQRKEEEKETGMEKEKEIKEDEQEHADLKKTNDA